METLTRGINIVNITNPFEPMGNREFKSAPSGLSLKECIDLVRSPLDGCFYVAAINGEVVPQDADYSLIYPKGSVVLCAVPEGGGGGGGKNTMRTVLMVVVTIVAMAATGYAGGAAGWGTAGSLGLGTTTNGVFTISTAGMAYAAAVGTAVGVAGGILVGLLCPYDMTGKDDESSTYSWGVTGENSNREGVVWPVLYGTARITPPIIGKYIECVDDKQYLNLLYAIADHSITDIDETSIRLNDNPVVKDEDNLTWEYRLGATTQSVIQNFTDLRDMRSINQKITKYTPWDAETLYDVNDYVDNDECAWRCLKAHGGIANCHEPEEGTYWTEVNHPWTTVEANGTNIQGLGVAIALPMGLYKNKSEGGTAPLKVYLDIEYKETNNLTWTRLTSHTKKTLDNYYDSHWSWGYWDGPNWVEIEVGHLHPSMHVEGETDRTKAVDWPTTEYGQRPLFQWHWVTTGDSIQGRDEVLSTYTVIEEEQMSSVRRVFYADNLPEGTYQVRVRFTKSHSPANNSRYVSDTYLEYIESIIYDDFTYPGSSIFAIRALATDKLYGGIPTLSLIATRSTVPVWNGSAYVNKPADNPAWASYDILHNTIYGGGVDKNKIRYSDFAAWAENCDEHYTAEGIASPVAFKCNIYLDASTTLRKTLNMIGQLGRGNTVQIGSEFSCFVDKLESLPVQSFIFNVANIKSKSFGFEYLPMAERANAIDVTFWDKENSYKQRTIELHAEDFDSTTTEIKKSQITLKGCVTLEEAMAHGYFALKSNRYLTCTCSFEADIDAIGCMPWDVIEVQHDVTLWGEGGLVISATTNTITLDKPLTLNPGATYTIRLQSADNDSIVEYTIATVDEITISPTVTIVGTFDPVPVQYDKWIVTATGAATKYFRVLKISRAGDLTRKLNCIEYFDGIYDDTATVPTPELPPTIIYEQNLKAEEIQSWDGSPTTTVNLSWSGFALLWHVFYQREGAKTFTYAGQTSIPFMHLTNLRAGDGSYLFCVSHTKNPADGITKTLQITGTAIMATPDAPVALSASLVGTSIQLTWSPSLDATTTGYSLYLNGTAVVQNYAGTLFIYNGALTAGVYTFTLKNCNLNGESAAVSASSITISIPSTPTPTTSVEGEMCVVTWPDCKTTLPIAYYKINDVIQDNSLRYQERITWTGEKIYSIVAVDVAGNESAAGSTTKTIATLNAPTGLTAAGSTYSILLSFVFETFTDFQCVEIWSSDVNNRNYAFQVGETAALTWAHGGLDLIDTRYYWIRLRNKYGSISTWYPASTTDGVEGSTSTNPADYLTILTGSITENQLVNTLNSRIDVLDTDSFLIENDIVEDGVFSGLSDAYCGLSEAQNILKTNISTAMHNAADALLTLEALQSEIAGLTTTPWSATGSYTAGRYVTYNSVVYRCMQAYDYPAVKTPGVDTAYWEEADAIATLLTEVESRVDTLEGEIVNKVSTTTYDLLEDRVTSAESLSSQNAADILLRVTQVDFDAFSQQFLPAFDEDNTYEVNEYVKSSGTAYVCIKLIDFTPAPTPGVTSGWEEYWEESDFAERFSSIINQVEINADGIDIMSQAITGPIALVSDIVENGIIVEDVGDITNIDTRISTAQIDVNGTKADILLHAALIEDYGNRLSQAEIDIDGANATIALKASKTDLNEANYNISLAEQTIDGHTATISSHTSLINSIEGRVSSAETTISAHTTSIADRLLTATYDTDQKDANNYLRLAALENRLEVYDTANATAYNAATTYFPGEIVLVSSVYYRCIKTALNKAPASNPTYWTAINAGLLSQWTLKLNVNNHVAGVGMMLDDSGSSEFVILSDKFMVVNPTDTMEPKAVFTVGDIDGNSGVGIKGDLIIDGSILTRNLAANCITADKIKAGEVTADKIGSGTITSKTIMLSAASGATYIGAGKTGFTNSQTGFILGVDNSGTAKFMIGNSSKYFNWDGTNMLLVGDMKTATGNGKRMEFSSADHRLYFYNDAGEEEVMLGASTGAPTALLALVERNEGVAADVAPIASIVIGTLACTVARESHGIITANCTQKASGTKALTNYGANFFVNGGNVNYGVYAEARNTKGTGFLESPPDADILAYGGYFKGVTGPIVLEPSTSAFAPSHAARKGTLWLTSLGTLYVNMSGSTTWTLIGPGLPS